jgi:hypothetical protein
VGGFVLSGDAAYVSLRADRALVAGDAQITHGTTTLHADAIAVDLPGRRIDLLNGDTGIARTDATLEQLQPAPGDGDAFDFPDLIDKHAYIRARTAEIVSHTSVRFRPAAFPTSTGAPPVPMYLYTFATANGYSASALSSAAFDQPYGLASTPNAFTALHLRWLNGIGPAVALQQTLIDNNNGFIAGAIDVPLHARIAEGLNGYRQLGETGTVSISGSVDDGYQQGQVGFTRAFGTLLGRLNFGITNTGYSTTLATLRTRDRLLFAGITGHVAINFGYQAQDGGLLPQSTPPVVIPTVWQHGIDAFVASPLIAGPLHSTLAVTLDASRTDYSYPHHYDALETVVSASRPLTRHITLFLGYDARYTSDIYPDNQLLFYSPIVAAYGYAGYGTNRLGSVALQYVNGPFTTLRVSYYQASDFPQVNNVAGRPPNAIVASLRVRPFANFGISFARENDFGWNNARWVPGWSFSVFQ